MLRIGICDDDPHMLNYLSALCKKILSGAAVAGDRSGVKLLSSRGIIRELMRSWLPIIPNIGMWLNIKRHRIIIIKNQYNGRKN